MFKIDKDEFKQNCLDNIDDSESGVEFTDFISKQTGYFYNYGEDELISDCVDFDNCLLRYSKYDTFYIYYPSNIKKYQ